MANIYNVNIVEWKYIFDKLNKDVANLGGQVVEMYNDMRGEVAVIYEIDGYYMHYFFNLGEYKRVSNYFDHLYTLGSYFLKSYLINGEIRAFVGKYNSKDNSVLPIGFDINKKHYTTFILDKDGFINENEMVSRLEKETDVKGFDPEFYKNIDMANLISALAELDVKDYIQPYIMRCMDSMNQMEKESVYRK